jgi:hypothetical protein
MGEIPKALARNIQNLAGPAAGEVSEMIRSERRPYRAARQVRLIEKTLRMIQKCGRQVGAVSPMILLPILDYAAVEDNEPLHSVWAALLANAAMLEDGLTITPVFIETLRQLSPVEATFLLSLFDLLEQSYGIDPDSLEFSAAQSVVLGTDVDLLIKYLKLGLGRPTETREQALRNIPGDLRDFMAILDNLERLNLLFYRLEDEAPGWGMPSEVKGMDPVRIYHLAMLGYQFMRACQIPQGTGTKRCKNLRPARKPN